ncbi:MAG: aminopeptidase P family protein [Bacteroidia bacterium]|nr:aminopeptidase P family protein [Bacteroidia bacterium]
MFSPNTYYERRKDLADFVSKGLIVLLGNDYSSMNYKDNYYPVFRQDSSFLYYIGLDKPGLVAVLDAESGECFLFGNEPTLDSMVWTGPEEGLIELGQKTAISQVLPIDLLGEFIKMTKSADREVHYLPPYRPEHVIKLSSLLKKGQREINAGVSLTLIQAIIHQRSIKSKEEIQELDKAADLSAQMHLHAMRTARPGMLESELMAQVQAIPVAVDSHPSFPIILTVHGEILHNHHYHNRLDEGKLLLLDCGAEASSHYAGDMTRTFPVSGFFTQQQKEIYQIVVDASDQVVFNMGPGVSYMDMHKLASRTIVEGLKAVGIMKGDAEEAVEAGAHALFFPHGLGHMLGLDVHDMENLGEDFVGYNDEIKRSSQFGLKSLRLGKDLQAGNAITVEPGIYFIPGLIDKWSSEGKLQEFINYPALHAYRSFGGIRLEDDYVITDSGSRLLGTPVARTIEEVEEIRAQAIS